MNEHMNKNIFCDHWIKKQREKYLQSSLPDMIDDPIEVKLPKEEIDLLGDWNLGLENLACSTNEK